MSFPRIEAGDLADQEILKKKIRHADGKLIMTLDLLRSSSTDLAVLQALGVRCVLLEVFVDKYLYESGLSPSQMKWELCKWSLAYPTISFKLANPPTHPSRWDNSWIVEISKRSGLAFLSELLLKLQLFLEAPNKISK